MIGPAQILILLEDWGEDLGDLTEDQFAAACVEHRRNSKFFPCTADIIEAHKVVSSRESVKPRRLALDRGPRPADFDQTKKVIQLLDEIKKNNPNMSYSDAHKLARKRNHDAKIVEGK